MSRLLLITTAAVLLAGCLGARHAPPPAPAPAPQQPPRGNNAAKTAPYEVFGQVYYPMTDAAGYRERGVASWYGGKFHGRRTANGEHYDMHQLTAAHKTLPLPTWVRVTNLRNGTAVTVRVNDRGPFVKNRLIDLSYAAATQIGMVDDGTTLVEVEVIDVADTVSGTVAASRPAPVPGVGPAAAAGSAAAAPAGAAATASAESAGPTPPAAVDPPPQPDVYVQVGAFSEPANAQRLRDSLYNAGIAEVLLSDADVAGIPVHRVRIGPVRGVAEYDALIAQLDSLGIYNTHLITE